MFNRLSIRLKLVVLLSLSATCALLISSSITLFSTFLDQRDESVRLLTQLADVSSENLRAALAFHDESSGQRLLQPLRTNPHIRMAMIEDETGKVFGRYTAADMGAADHQRYLGNIQRAIRSLSIPRIPAIHAFEDVGLDYTVVVRPIVFEDRWIGKFAIVSDNAVLVEKIRHHLIFQALLSLATLIWIVLISIPLQRLFTQPIYELLAAMQHISNTQDYKIRVISKRQDEFLHLANGFNTMLADIDQRDERLGKLATTDALTGMANRRHAMDVLSVMVLRAHRKSEPLGIIMIDVDFFKHINDTYGHPVGDMVLKNMATLLMSCARNLDLIARIGGEEFLILCDNSDTLTTQQVAERVRILVEHHTFEHSTGQIKVTVSSGVYAGVPSDCGDEEMIRRADNALYRAKMSGKNRVTIWETS